MDIAERPPVPSPRKTTVATAAFAIAGTGIAIGIWAFLGGATPGSERLRPNGPIVFAGPGLRSGLGVDNTEIYAFDPESEITLNLSNSPAEEKEPAWSREGIAVAFTRTALEETGPGDLAAHRGIFLLDSGGLREIMSCRDDYCKEHGVALSPDGSRIAFIRSGALAVTDTTDGSTTEICAERECGHYLAQIAWSPDGDEIAFAESAPRHGLGLDPSGILVANLRSDSIQKITNAGCSLQDREGDCSFDSSPQWSPDGMMIAFNRTTQDTSSHHAIFLMKSDGTDVKQVARCKEHCGFTWAPDGQRIALMEFFQPTIRVVRVADGEETILGACRDVSCNRPYEVAWSPDGSELVFLASREGETEMYVAQADGGDTKRIDTGGRAHCCLAWLPESSNVSTLIPSASEASIPARPAAAPVASSSGLLAFSGDPSGGNEDETEVFSSRADGTELTQLTNNPSFRIANLYPSWSSDGTRIHFYRQSFGDRPSEMFVMDVDGTDQQRSELPVHGAVSPDETRVAFSSEKHGDGNIYVMNVDGSARRAITDPGHQEANENPVWSPEGTRILFENHTHKGVDLFVANDDGSGLQRITDLPGNEQDADWSPDGSQIVFAWWTAAGSDLYLMNSDGTGLRRLTDFAGGAGSPAWSPDGTTIAFNGETLLAGQGYHYGIYTIRRDGTGLFQVTPSGDTIFFGAAWQPEP